MNSRIRRYWKFSDRRKRIKSRFVYVQKDINNLIKLSPLSLIIGEHIKLTKRGKNYVGRCPMCRVFTDNKYHFVVSDIKHMFKCFECGIGGRTSPGFLTRYYSISFEDALLFINRKYHNNTLLLRVQGIVAKKYHSNSSENLPF